MKRVTRVIGLIEWPELVNALYIELQSEHDTTVQADRTGCCIRAVPVSNLRLGTRSVPISLPTHRLLLLVYFPYFGTHCNVVG
jgi:hypothetical protein